MHLCKRMKKKKNFLVSVLIVIVSAFIAGFALLHPGLPPTHDGEYHVVRFYQFDKTLRDGNWYPRWASDLNNGYGVPLFNYVYPLPNYVASFLHALGFSFIDTFKVSMFVATIVGGIFFYLWSRQYWGDTGAVVSAVFYTFSPYRFVDIYIRGSVGEVWALAFFPAFLWSATKGIREQKLFFAPLSGLFLALIIFSHNILAIMFFIFALSYVFFLIFLSKEKLYAIRYFLYAIFLGLTLSAIFWFPALFEQQYVTGLQIYDIGKNFPQLYQLLIPSWGSGFSEGALENQLSFQIGLANLAALFFSFVSMVIFYKKKDKRALIIGFFLCWFLFVFFLMLKVSMPIWQYVPFMNYFQFPWRFLSLAILATAFLAGAIFSIWRSKILAGTLIIFAILLSIGYAKPAYYHQRQDEYYLTRSNFIDGTNSPGDLFNTIWFNKGLKKQKEKIKVEHGTVSSIDVNPTRYTFDIYADSNTSVTANTAYFLGWTAIIDKKEIGIKPDNNGLITFFVPKGKHHIELLFRDTSTREIGTSIFLISLLSIMLYFPLHPRAIISIYEKK